MELILSLIAKFWPYLLAIGVGGFFAWKGKGFLDNAKISNAERKAENATAVARHADKAVKAEKQKTEQIKAETAIKDKVRDEEQSIEDKHDTDLLDLANSMFDDTKTD
jgi:hypothetical protein